MPLWSVAGVVALGAFGVSIIAQLLVLVLKRYSGAAALADETPIGLALGALLVQLALAIFIGVTLRNAPTLRKRALVVHRVSLGILLLGVGVVLGIAPAANELGYYLSQTLHEPVDSALWVARVIQRANMGELVLLGFALTVVPACVEELLFRGLLMGALTGAPRAVVLLVPAVLFGAFHVDFAQGTATLVLGLGFGFLRMTTRSLLTPIVAHATYNSVVLLSMRAMQHTASPPRQNLAVLFGGLAVSLVCALVLGHNRRSHFSKSEGR